MEQLFFAGKAYLKINSLVKTPLHEFMAVERAGLWAPDKDRPDSPPPQQGGPEPISRLIIVYVHVYPLSSILLSFILNSTPIPPKFNCNLPLSLKSDEGGE